MRTEPGAKPCTVPRTLRLRESKISIASGPVVPVVVTLYLPKAVVVAPAAVRVKQAPAQSPYAVNVDVPSARSSRTLRPNLSYCQDVVSAFGPVSERAPPNRGSK